MMVFVNTVGVFVCLVAVVVLVDQSETAAVHDLRTTKYKRTVKYDGEILVRCAVHTPSVQSFLKKEYIDVWRITPDGEADIRMPEDMFESSGLGLDKECVKIADIESLVQESERKTFTGPKANWFEEYHPYEDIVVWYEDLARDNPDLVKYEVIGTSTEGRVQPVVRITGSVEESRNRTYFQCQIHAREWISGATCMYIANYLVEQYDNSSSPVRDILNTIEFVFFPLTNPDGYAYSWTGDRLWRKNRRVNEGTTCRGVDLNRNYDDGHWGEEGTSDNPCSEVYLGTEPASEKETQNSVICFKQLENLVGAIDWHSYSQLILRPYGFREIAPDEERLKEIGDEMSNRIREVNGLEYTSQRAVDLYPATGGASDWFYSEGANSENKYRAAGFTIELRDTGRYGFLLPPDQIIPQGEEMIPAVLYFAETLNTDGIRKPN